MRVRLERRGLRWRVYLEPVIACGAADRSSNLSPASQHVLPPMPGAHAIAARHELRALLDRARDSRRVWPSLALLERVLASENAENIHLVEACVLRHAAHSLDQLGDELLGPGLVELRRRLEFVLRRKHGDRPSHWLRMPPPIGAERAASFGDCPTDYIQLDRLQPTARQGQNRDRSGRLPPRRRAT
jgi:hypothetical protein